MYNRPVMHKYVLSECGELIIFFGGIIHAEAAELLKRKTNKFPVSAGFVTTLNGRLKCFGGSDSLNINSRKEDAAILSEKLKLLN